jgi:hypothetical protein
MESIARIMVFSGLALVVFGGLFWALSKAVWFGRLPGDLSLSGDNVSVYVPIASMLLVSLVLTIVLNIAVRVFR